MKPLCTIHIVCALHEHEHTQLQALIKFEKYKFNFGYEQVDWASYLEGASPLQAG